MLFNVVLLSLALSLVAAAPVPNTEARIVEKTTIARAFNGDVVAFRRDDLPPVARQTSNVDEQLLEEVELELKSLFRVRRAEIRQTSNVDEQLLEEIESELKGLFRRSEPRQTSNVDEQLLEEVESELKSLFRVRRAAVRQTLNADEQLLEEIESELKGLF